MYIGAHVSIAGGINLAPRRAFDLQLECFQFFSRSPQGGPAPKLTPDLVNNFLLQCAQCSMREWAIHTPYYINLAHPLLKTRVNSIRIIREELERASLLHTSYVMTHLGSSREVGHKQGITYCIEGINRIMDGYTGNAQFLIEISAGAGSVMGSTFEDLAEILSSVDPSVGICYDTQHGFASGYDMRDEVSLQKTLDQFDACIGLPKLKISHCNDSKIPFGEQKDRHEHLGKGCIGENGFRAWMQNPRLQQVNLYLETEHDFVLEDVALLKSLRP